MSDPVSSTLDTVGQMAVLGLYGPSAVQEGKTVAEAVNRVADYRIGDAVFAQVKEELRDE